MLSAYTPSPSGLHCERLEVTRRRSWSIRGSRREVFDRELELARRDSARREKHDGYASAPGVPRRIAAVERGAPAGDGPLHVRAVGTRAEERAPDDPVFGLLLGIGRRREPLGLAEEARGRERI